MAKKILFNQDARDALKRGVDAVANAVRITIGLEAVKKDKSGPAQKTVETVVGIR